MNEEQDKLIDDQFKSLPKNLQRAIALSPWRILINEIGKRENLAQDQLTAIEQETLLVLYAFEPPEEYVSNMVKEANLTEELANKIASEASEKIFEPISTKKEQFDADEKKETPPTNQENYMIPSSNNITDPRNDAVTKLEQAANLPEEQMSIEIAPETHPQTIPGETAHEVIKEKEVENTDPTITIPPKDPEIRTQTKSSYPGGQDPYREPIE